VFHSVLCEYFRTISGLIFDMSKNNIMIPKNSSAAEEYCRKIQSNGKQSNVKDSDIGGLVLRVMASGSKKWALRYSIKIGEKWKDRLITIGDFKQGKNDINGLTVTAARKEAYRLKYEIKFQGADPVEDKHHQALQRKTQSEIHTVNALFDEWFNEEICKRKDGGKEVKRMIAKDVLPKIGNLPINMVQKRDISFINGQVKQRGDRIANVVFTLTRQMFNFAIEKDYLEHNPTSGIKKSKVGSSGIMRERVLDNNELIELLQKLPESGLVTSSPLAIHIVLSTCCRIGELIKASWEHVNIEQRLWFIPAVNSKNGIQHKIWLSDYALSYFKQLYTLSGDSEWCFPSSRINSHICPKTITKQVGDRQKAEHRIKSRTKHIKALLLKSGAGEQWRPHDLRRTGATVMTMLGVIPDVAERCLNHIEENKVKRTYQRHNYWPEMILAWERLGNYLTNLNE